MKVSTENDNNFGYEKITILVDKMPLSKEKLTRYDYNLTIMKSDHWNEIAYNILTT
jgi:hypothetical protein